MKKAYIIIVIFWFYNTAIITAQGGFRDSYHNYSMNGNELWIYQIVSFSNWDGPSCPPIDSSSIIRSGNIKRVDIFYDLRVAGPHFGCARTDTLHDTLAYCHPCTLAVNSHIILNHTGVNDTLFVNTDTSYFTVLNDEIDSTKRFLKIYPNPTSGLLYLDKPNSEFTYSLGLINMLGQLVFFEILPPEETSIVSHELPSGLYQYALLSEYGKIEFTGKLVIIE